MKILLINPPVFNDIGECKSDTPPLSLLYLAGYLEKYGFGNIKVLDADREGLTWSALGELLLREKPDVVGIGGPSFVLPALIKTAEVAREKLPDCLIVAGGFGPTKEPEKVLRAANRAINFAVIGEGEITFLELVKQQASGQKDFNNVKGLAFLSRDGSLIITEPRGYIMDLDSIPWPAFHLLASDFSKYPGAPLSPKKYKEMKEPRATIVGARGCPHRCTFCSLGSRTYRQRSPKDIVAEMEYYKNKFKVRSIQIYDDEFIGMSPKQNEWVREICDEIIKKNLQKDLTFLVQGRCSQFVDLETLKIMKKAGFAWIWWGVESGSQRILDDVIHKDIKIENVYRAFDLAKKAGLKSLMFIMVGFPGETPSDVKLSADLIKKIKPDDVGIHILTPYPGSELRKYFESNNLLDNIDDYYKYDTNMNVNYHTKEMTASEIMKYYRLLIFRFEHNNWHFIKFGFKSLATLDGWRKLFKRIRIVFGYFAGWLDIGFKNKLRENKIIGRPYRTASAFLVIVRGIVFLWLPLTLKNPKAARFLPQWIFSFDSNQNTFQKGLPWLTFEAVEWLDSYLTKEKRVFEWGSGGSTIFLAQKAKDIVSVEHNPEWYELVLQRIKNENIVNCKYILQAPEKGEGMHLSRARQYQGFNFDKYCQVIELYPDNHFDLIFIDGRSRTACAQKAVAKLKSGGFLMLDDSDTEEYLKVGELLKDWPRQDFFGLKRGAITFYQTTIWQK